MAEFVRDMGKGGGMTVKVTSLAIVGPVEI
jgi:hypothetical protein